MISIIKESVVKWLNTDHHPPPKKKSNKKSYRKTEVKDDFCFTFLA